MCPGEDKNVSRMSAYGKNALLSVSACDTTQPEKDMSVSTLSTYDNDDKLSVSTSDIFPSVKGYMEMGGGGLKRRRGDPGRWWLPPSTSWRASQRRRWPSSRTTSEVRRGGWSRSTDPSQAEQLLEEHIRHKEIWRELELTKYVDRESADGGGARGDRDAQHHDQEDQVGPGVGLVEHLHRDQGEAGADIHRARRVRPDQQQADGQGGQGGRGDGGAQQRGHEDQLSLEMGLVEQVHCDQDQGRAGGDGQRARRVRPDQQQVDGQGGQGGRGD